MGWMPSLIDVVAHPVFYSVIMDEMRVPRMRRYHRCRCLVGGENILDAGASHEGFLEEIHWGRGPYCPSRGAYRLSCVFRSFSI